MRNAETITYKVKYHNNLLYIFIMVLYVYLLSRDLLYGNVIVVNIWLGLLLMAVLVNLFIQLIRFIKSKPTVTIAPDSIKSTSGKVYLVRDIEKVYKDRRRIGLKLRNKKLVPNDLCFVFDRVDEEEGLHQLSKWTDSHNIPFKNRFFITLI